MRASTLALLCMGLSNLCGCLPTDSREPPGKFLLTVSGPVKERGIAPTVVTDDGWTITFDKILISVGDAELSGVDCNSYYDSSYERVLNLMLPGPQKVNELYARGACELRYRLEGAFDHRAVVGADVSTEDVALMGHSPFRGNDFGGSDDYDDFRPRTLYVKARATNGEIDKTLSWGFGQHAEYQDCVLGTTASTKREFELDADKNLSVNIDIDMRALFDSRGTNAELFAPLPEADLAVEPRFQAFADADTKSGDGDGVITLDEVANVKLETLQSGGRYRTPIHSIDTLRDFVRIMIIARKLANHIDGGLCTGNP